MPVPISEADAVAIMLRADVKPLSPYPGSKVGWKSLCLKCQREVSPRLGNIRSGQSACAYCAGVRIDMQDAIMLFASVELTPLVDFPGAQKPWQSMCLVCKQVVSPTYTSIQQGSRGCVYCARNRINAQDAISLMEECGYKPIEPYPGSGKKWKCVCLICGKLSFPRYGDVRIGNRCGYCSKVRVDESEAIELMKTSNLLPLDPFVNTTNRWRCRCLVCENIVFPTYATIRGGGGGCRHCASYGFNLSAPAILYLITNKSLSAHKVGITNLENIDNNSRLIKHKRNGWSIYKTKQFSRGESALLVEQLILVWIRESLNLGQYLTSEQMPQGGWTETLDANEIDLSTIWTKVEELSQGISENLD